MPNDKEAKARIKINKLLERTGWRFLDDENGPANIVLEPNTKITVQDINALGEDFEKTKKGFIDFLLLDDAGFPLVILEAKREGISPLDAKEQAPRPSPASGRGSYTSISKTQAYPTGRLIQKSDKMKKSK